MLRDRRLWQWLLLSERQRQVRQAVLRLRTVGQGMDVLRLLLLWLRRLLAVRVLLMMRLRLRLRVLRQWIRGRPRGIRMRRR